MAKESSKTIRVSDELVICRGTVRMSNGTSLNVRQARITLPPFAERPTYNVTVYSEQDPGNAYGVFNITVDTSVPDFGAVKFSASTSKNNSTEIYFCDYIVMGLPKLSPKPGRKKDSPKSRYAPLAGHLTGLPKRTKEVTLTFAEVEKILGARLPASAFNHREWWGNQSNTKNRPQAKAWTDAGFKVETVVQGKSTGWVRFRRK